MAKKQVQVWGKREVSWRREKAREREREEFVRWWREMVAAALFPRDNDTGRCLVVNYCPRIYETRWAGWVRSVLLLLPRSYLPKAVITKSEASTTITTIITKKLLQLLLLCSYACCAYIMFSHYTRDYAVLGISCQLRIFQPWLSFLTVSEKSLTLLCLFPCFVAIGWILWLPILSLGPLTFFFLFSSHSSMPLAIIFIQIVTIVQRNEWKNEETALSCSVWISGSAERIYSRNVIALSVREDSMNKVWISGSLIW